MKAVYRLNFDCGRMGSLPGVFVAEKEDVHILIESGIHVHFGEVLGKHSDVCGPIEESDIEEITDDEKVVSVIEQHNLSSGYNPFDYGANGYIFDDDNEEDEFEGTIQELVDEIKVRNGSSNS